MNMRFLLLLMIALLLLALGCRSTNTMERPTGGTSTHMAPGSFTHKDMRAAILKGCIDRNWRAVEINANMIEATNTVRGKHTVVVTIPYSASSYSIDYKSSTNMDYKINSDGTISIHPNYNSWVNNLNDAIRAEIDQANIHKKK